jgi:hypothetical protein
MALSDMALGVDPARGDHTNVAIRSAEAVATSAYSGGAADGPGVAVQRAGVQRHRPLVGRRNRRRRELGHLFERFHRTEAATAQAVQGSGLGLSISKSIVEAHEGTIDAASRPGGGTTMTIELPAAPDPDGVARPAPGSR